MWFYSHANRLRTRKYFIKITILKLIPIAAKPNKSAHEYHLKRNEIDRGS